MLAPHNLVVPANQSRRSRLGLGRRPRDRRPPPTRQRPPCLVEEIAVSYLHRPTIRTRLLSLDLAAQSRPLLRHHPRHHFNLPRSSTNPSPNPPPSPYYPSKPLPNSKSKVPPHRGRRLPSRRPIVFQDLQAKPSRELVWARTTHQQQGHGEFCVGYSFS